MYTCICVNLYIYVLANSRNIWDESVLYRSRSTGYIRFKCKLNKLVKILLLSNMEPGYK